MTSIEGVSTFDKDGRTSIEDLYARFNLLCEQGWKSEVIARWEDKLPIVAYTSPNWNEGDKGIWVIAGIHGEEPAGPMAIAREIPTLIDLVQSGIPIVCLPLLNPGGYFKNWRYFGLKRWKRGKVVISVGDSEYLLLNKKRDGPRRKKPASELTEAIIEWILQASQKYPPQLVVDHHEDGFTLRPLHHGRESYIYFSGNPELVKTAEIVVGILQTSGFPIAVDGKTFGFLIRNGVVTNLRDGSVDELLASSRIWQNGRIQKREPAPAVITVETGFDPCDYNLGLRVQAHMQIIRAYPELWEMVCK